MRRMLALLIAGVGLLTVPAGADEVDDLVKALKPSPLDYAVWAGNLLGAVGDLRSSPDAQVRVYGKAYDLGFKTAKGYPAAIKAARAMLKANPAQKAEWQQKLLAVYKRDWQSADRRRKRAAGRVYVEQMVAVAEDMSASDGLAESISLYTTASRMVRYYAPDLRDRLASKLKDARARQKLQQDLDRCRRVLAAQPDNTAVRETLIGLYVVELGQPGEAEKLLTAGVSERLRTYVPLATKPVDQVAKDACQELGDWYRLFVAGATRGGKSHVLGRGKAYYERYVALETDAVRRTTGKAKLAAVEKELKALGVPVWPAAGKFLILDLGKGVTMKLVRIPAGGFTMGSPRTEVGRRPEEGPQRQVTISKPFYMGLTEVTQLQYGCIMDRNPSKFLGARNPVAGLSWDDAVAFCETLSKKTGRVVCLPTSAQWEYACRAGTTTRFSFGDDIEDLDAYGWYKANSGGRAHPVGQKKPNAWGLYDMHGNVWEWCRDWYDEKFYRRAKNVDPENATEATHRVIRGGAWGSAPPRYCRSASGVPGKRRHGLRVVVTAGSR